MTARELALALLDPEEKLFLTSPLPCIDTATPLIEAHDAEVQEECVAKANSRWTLPFAYLVRLQAEMNPEYPVGLEEIETVLLASRKSEQTVPMAMLVALAKHGLESYRKDDYYDRETDLIEIATRYGYKVEGGTQ